MSLREDLETEEYWRRRGKLKEYLHGELTKEELAQANRDHFAMPLDPTAHRGPRQMGAYAWMTARGD